MFDKRKIVQKFALSEHIVVYPGDCLDLLKTTIIWFKKSDGCAFHLDPVRVPRKYPGKKYFKGPSAGKYPCNPLGKNPRDGRIRQCRIL